VSAFVNSAAGSAAAAAAAAVATVRLGYVDTWGTTDQACGLQNSQFLQFLEGKV
jgi:hypothetical protein